MKQVKRPSRILMVINMPWSRDLGASQAVVEIAEEFRNQGHTVDKFDAQDAFPRQTKLSSFFFQSEFASRAACYVKQHGREFDIIQADPGQLPFFKQELNFDGLLVARSNGLLHFHQQYARGVTQKEPWKQHSERLIEVVK